MILSKALRAAAGNIAPAPPSTDPQFNYVSMLLHGDGTNGAQNNTFLDSSSNNFTITRNGNTTQGSLSPYGSLWSNYFDGAGDYLSASSNAALSLPGAFTFECWFYPNSFDQVSVIGDTIFSCIAVGSLTIARTSSTTGNAWGIAETGVAWRLTSTTLPTNNTWNHLVAVRDASNNAALFLNGVRVASGSLTTSFAQNGFSLGSDNGSANSFLDGYLSNVRLVKGTAVYSPTSTTLTVPTAPLTAISGTSLLTCQSNRFIDNSANNFTITRNGDVRVTKESPFLPTAAYSTSTIGGSGYFGGSGNSLVLASNASFAVGTGQYTIEGWFYFTGSSVGTLDNFLACMGGSFTAGCLTFWYNGSNELQLVAGGGFAASKVAGTITLIPGQWYHIAGTRDASSVQRLFVNGVLLNSATITYSFSQAGFHVNGYSSMTGYAADVRLIVGAAAYTAAFTPPTAPLTAPIGTRVLLNFTNAGIFDNAAENDLETVGNAQISTSVKKYGTGSVSFNGLASTYLLTNGGPQVEFGSGNFTIEMWINFITTPSNTVEYQLWHPVNHTSGQKRLSILIYANDVGMGYFGTNVAVTSGLSWTTGQWYHLAFVRNGNTWTIYRDGTSVASGTNTSTLNVASGYYTGPRINGYIDDLRITKGYARYTSNFTPPTQAFPDQ